VRQICAKPKGKVVAVPRFQKVLNALVKADAEGLWALRPAADAAEKIVPLAINQ
jgi:hypothetical protein